MMTDQRRLGQRFNFDVFSSLSVIRRYAILIALFVIVGVLVVFRLLLPGFNQLTSVQNEIKDNRRRLTALDSKINDLKTTSNTDITMMADRYLLAIPRANSYLSLFDGIKKIADLTGVTITSLELNPGLINALGSEKIQKKQYNQLSVSVEIDSSFEAVRQMVARLESTLPIIKVSDLSFESRISSDSAALTKVKVKMTLLSYWSGLPEYLAKVDSPLVRLTKEDYDLYLRLEDYLPVVTDQTSSQETTPVSVGRENPFPI